jgi:hypothetical protein
MLSENRVVDTTTGARVHIVPVLALAGGRRVHTLAGVGLRPEGPPMRADARERKAATLLEGCHAAQRVVDSAERVAIAAELASGTADRCAAAARVAAAAALVALDIATALYRDVLAEPLEHL